MPDILSAMREFRSLDDKRRSSGLAAADESRWQELRSALKGPGSGSPPPRNEVVEPAPVEPPPPTTPQSGPQVPEGYLLDEGSGYLWHEGAQHWFDPQTSVYFDVDGNALDAGEAQAAAARRPAAPVEPIEADLGGNPDERLELATQVDFLDTAALVNHAAPRDEANSIDLPEDDGPPGELQLATAAELATGEHALPPDRVRRRDRMPTPPVGPAEWDPEKPDAAGTWDASDTEARAAWDSTDPNLRHAPPPAPLAPVQPEVAEVPELTGTASWDAPADWAAAPAAVLTPANVEPATGEWNTAPETQETTRWRAPPQQSWADAAPLAPAPVEAGWETPATPAPQDAWVAAESAPAADWNPEEPTAVTADWASSSPTEAPADWTSLAPPPEAPAGWTSPAEPVQAAADWVAKAPPATASWAAPAEPASSSLVGWESPPENKVWAAEPLPQGPTEWTPADGLPAVAVDAAVDAIPVAEVPWDHTPTETNLGDAPTGRMRPLAQRPPESAWSATSNYELTPVVPAMVPALVDDIDVIDPALVTSVEGTPPRPGPVDVLDDLEVVAVETTPRATQMLALPPGQDDFDAYAPAVVPEPPPRPRPVPVMDPRVTDSPGFVSGRHRVVVHTRDGMTRRGELQDADLEGEAISLIGSNGPERVPTAEIKAVFFMLAPGQRPPPPQGRKVKVTFQDGRELPGFAITPPGSEKGFFLLPADTRTNTERIFVYRDAVREMIAS